MVGAPVSVHDLSSWIKYNHVVQKIDATGVIPRV
jgi:hypothetical protein